MAEVGLLLLPASLCKSRACSLLPKPFQQNAIYPASVAGHPLLMRYEDWTFREARYV